MKKQRTFIAAGLGAVLAAAFVWYYDVYVYWQPKLYPFAIIALVLGVAALTLLALRARGEDKRAALAWKTALSAVAFAGALIGVSAIINNAIGGGRMARQAAAVALPLCAAQVLVLYVLLLRAGKSLSRKAVALMSAGLAVFALSAGVLGVGLPYYLRDVYRVPPPPGRPSSCVKTPRFEERATR